MDLDQIKGIGPATKDKLQSAGVVSVEDLAKRDPDALAETIGTAPGRVRQFVEQAQERLTADAARPNGNGGDEPTPAKTPESTGETVAAGSTEADVAATHAWKVVLQDRSSTARVDAKGRTFENLPIVTAKADEDVEEIQKGIGYNAVLLKEGETTALVRVDGEWEPGVPIYKQKALDDSGTTELVRVRVHEIRERPGATGAGTTGRVKDSSTGGFLGRFFGKK